MSNTDTTQEQRKVIQVTMLPSVYKIAKDRAAENGTHPGRVIESAIQKLVKKP